MSYILEALRKAEAERRTGSAPSIHTPPSFNQEAPESAPWHRHRPWVGSVAALLATGATVWYVSRQPPPAPPPEFIAAVAPQATQGASPTHPDPAPRSKIPARPEEPAVKTAEKRREKSTSTAPESKPAPRKSVAESSTRESTRREASPVLTLQQLPDAVRSEIPGFKVAGYIYSDNKAERSVLINKRLFREGDEVSPGLKLEKMTPEGLVLSYKGYRYHTPY